MAAALSWVWLARQQGGSGDMSIIVHRQLWEDASEKPPATSELKKMASQWQAETETQQGLLPLHSPEKPVKHKLMYNDHIYVVNFKTQTGLERPAQFSFLLSINELCSTETQ